MAKEPRTYTIGPRDFFVLKVTKHATLAARAADPSKIDGMLDDIGVTNEHERLHLKAVARRHLQQQALAAQQMDYVEGRATWDGGDHENGIPNSDEPGTGAAPWEPEVEPEE